MCERLKKMKKFKMIAQERSKRGQQLIFFYLKIDFISKLKINKFNLIYSVANPQSISHYDDKNHRLELIPMTLSISNDCKLFEFMAHFLTIILVMHRAMLEDYSHFQSLLRRSF